MLSFKNISAFLPPPHSFYYSITILHFLLVVDIYLFTATTATKSKQRKRPRSLYVTFHGRFDIDVLEFVGHSTTERGRVRNPFPSDSTF